MNNFLEKANQIKELSAEIDSYIWSIFKRYINECGILFSDPRGWEICDCAIDFRGYDGCMGCYDPMAISIPLNFFIDPDKEFELEAQRRKQKLAAKKAELQQIQEEYERKLFLKLKKKFDK
jgi:hypothetical protein